MHQLDLPRFFRPFYPLALVVRFATGCAAEPTCQELRKCPVDHGAAGETGTDGATESSSGSDSPLPDAAGGGGEANGGADGGARGDADASAHSSGIAVLGDPCSTLALLACAGHAQKLTLICD